MVERKQKEKEEKDERVHVAAAMQQGWRLMWGERPVRFHRSQESVFFHLASTRAKRSVACKGQCLESAGKRLSSSEQPVLARSEADKWFSRHCSGKAQVRFDGASVFSVSPGVDFSRDSPRVDSCRDSSGVDPSTVIRCLTLSFCTQCFIFKYFQCKKYELSG